MRRAVIGLLALIAGGAAADEPLAVTLRSDDDALALPPRWCAEDPALAAELPARARYARESWRAVAGRLDHCYRIGFDEPGAVAAAAARRQDGRRRVVIALGAELTACFAYPPGQRAARMQGFARAVPLLAPLRALEWTLGQPTELTAGRVAGDGPDGYLGFGRAAADLAAAGAWLEAAGFAGDPRRGWIRLPATGARTSVVTVEVMIPR
jgi:hypothetical protein